MSLSSRWLHLLLLLVALAIGTGLRFTHLASKPPWNDEFATVVFSLGNSLRTVPLDQAIALDTLLRPLQPLTPSLSLVADLRCCCGYPDGRLGLVTSLAERS